MRSIATTVATAIDLKRMQPKEEEELLVMQSLRESTIPKLIGEDMELFISIVRDLFPNVDVSIPEEEDLKVCILKSLHKMGLQVQRDNVLD